MLPFYQLGTPNKQGGCDELATKKKLLEKIRRNVRNVSLEDFEGLINMFGYIEMGGKHPKAIIGN
ncbi:MAG: hypothetical protein FJ013_04230, partial [Chloroflexi bacterium]|nr:hypothetical protein [Chloroflexota bacterium]